MNSKSVSLPIQATKLPQVALKSIKLYFSVIGKTLPSWSLYFALLFIATYMQQWLKGDFILNMIIGLLPDLMLPFFLATLLIAINNNLIEYTIKYKSIFLQIFYKYPKLLLATFFYILPSIFSVLLIFANVIHSFNYQQTTSVVEVFFIALLTASSIFVQITFSFIYIYIAIENQGIWHSFKDCWCLVVGNWWRTLGVFLIGMIIYVSFALILNVLLSILTAIITKFLLLFHPSSTVLLLPNNIKIVGMVLGTAILTPLTACFLLVQYYDLQARKGMLSKAEEQTNK